NDLSGPIQDFYDSYGGPTSNIGWPTSGMKHAPDKGRQVLFEHGVVLHARGAGGAHVTYGPMMTRWQQEGGGRGLLGYPTTSILTPKVGLRQRYDHGIITWVRATKTFVIKHL